MRRFTNDHEDAAVCWDEFLLTMPMSAMVLYALVDLSYPLLQEGGRSQ